MGWEVTLENKIWADPCSIPSFNVISHRRALRLGAAWGLGALTFCPGTLVSFIAGKVSYNGQATV